MCKRNERVEDVMKVKGMFYVLMKYGCRRCRESV
jgi:hypothetical protein